METFVNIWSSRVFYNETRDCRTLVPTHDGVHKCEAFLHVECATTQSKNKTKSPHPRNFSFVIIIIFFSFQFVIFW